MTKLASVLWWWYSSLPAISGLDSPRASRGTSALFFPNRLNTGRHFLASRYPCDRSRFTN